MFRTEKKKGVEGLGQVFLRPSALACRLVPHPFLSVINAPILSSEDPGFLPLRVSVKFMSITQTLKTGEVLTVKSERPIAAFTTAYKCQQISPDWASSEGHPLILYPKKQQ